MDFLDKIPLDQTALTIAMVAIVLLFALISIIKGIIKTIITLVSLSIAAAAFLFGFLQSPPYIENFIPEAIGWMPLVVGGVCALLAMVILQVFLGVFSGKSKKKKKKAPQKESDEGESSSGKSSRNPLAPVFGLLVGILALYGAITALRYFGTNAELEHLQTYVTEGAENAGEVPLIVQAKQWLDDSPIATWQEKFDILNTADYRSRLNLAKLIIISGDREDLAKALQEEINKEVIKVPEINAVTVTGDDLRALCKDCDFPALFQDERFQRLTTRPSTRRELLRVKLDEFLSKVEGS
jgi:hypothetical protein